MPKVKTLKLDGTEIAVKFPYSYPYYMIANMGDGETYVSGNPDIVPYGDGVYTVLPGTETRISPERSGDTVYLLGSGTVQIRAEEIAVQTSFRLAGKGGGDDDGSSTKPVNYIHLYGTGVQGVGAIRVDYKHPLTKSGVENLCVLMTALAENNNNRGYYQATGTSDAVKPYDTYAEIIPYNFGSRPTILSIVVAEPDN